MAQQEDSTLKKVREMVNSGDEKVSKGGARSVFVTKCGIIYRRFKQGSGSQNQTCSQLVVPKKYRNTVLKLAHETLMSGHFSSKKTVSRILIEF